MTKSLTFVEVDIDYCQLNYGVAPCQAVLGVTGDAKCFNSANTCQDRVNFDGDTVTLRFAVDCDYLPQRFNAIPCIREVSFNPARISLGQDLGERATLTVTFQDHRHSDAGEGFDKYYAERDYDPFRQGTFFGKFRARQPFLRGSAIRLIRGLLEQSDIDDMDTRHYVIESFNGPTPDGVYTITAKDVLKLADDDRAQAPMVSNGFLSSTLTDVAVSLTMNPVGIGNLEYPSSGYAAIGGEEIVFFSRTNDTMSITRGQFGTDPAAHEAQDRVQLCLVYQGEDPADIITDLFENYAGIDGDFIDTAAWLNETQTFLGRLYSAVIAEPTGVNKLVSELIEQAGLIVWWDDLNLLIRLQVIRAISTAAALFDEDNTMAGSLAVREQPNSRVSQVWTYYGQRNPLKPLDETENWRSTLATIDGERESDYGSAAIKKIFARWIPAFARSVADRLNDIVISRFRDPPRAFAFDVYRYGADTVFLGSGYQVTGWSIQGPAGDQVNALIQVTRLKHLEDRFQVEAEEMLVSATDISEDLANRTIIIDSDFQNFNLREIHDGIYPEPTAFESPSIFITCIIETQVLVGSDSTSDPAFDVGDWPADVSITVIVKGRIQGRGGDGGQADEDFGHFSGQPGGTALYTRYPIDLVLNDGAGQVWGGGGGGGGGSGGNSAGGGGGGAGQLPGAGGAGAGGAPPGAPGTTEAGGLGGVDGDFGGNGGNPGQAGSQGNDAESAGGAAGVAIDGNSFISYTGSGDVRGAQVN